MGTDGKSVFEILIWEPNHEERWDITGFQSQDFFKQDSSIYFNIFCVLVGKNQDTYWISKRIIFRLYLKTIPDDATRY